MWNSFFSGLQTYMLNFGSILKVVGKYKIVDFCVSNQIQMQDSGNMVQMVLKLKTNSLIYGEENWLEEIVC